MAFGIKSGETNVRLFVNVDGSTVSEIPLGTSGNYVVNGDNAGIVEIVTQNGFPLTLRNTGVTGTVTDEINLFTSMGAININAPASLKINSADDSYRPSWNNKFIATLNDIVNQNLSSTSEQTTGERFNNKSVYARTFTYPVSSLQGNFYTSLTDGSIGNYDVNYYDNIWIDSTNSFAMDVHKSTYGFNIVQGLSGSTQIVAPTVIGNVNVGLTSNSGNLSLGTSWYFTENNPNKIIVRVKYTKA